MKVSELLERRRANWRELESLCDGKERDETLSRAERVARFAALYRAVCADLALADAYQLPAQTVEYLHRLVGRAHNRLYRSRHFQMDQWSHKLLRETPQQVFHDRCVQVAFLLFWGAFLLSAVLAYSNELFPEYVEQVVGKEFLQSLESSFSEPIEGRDPTMNYAMAGFYIQHNTGIGLKCFASGLLLIPGLFMCIFNAAFLGAAFGYMARPDVPEGANFFHFVTAHGPFELTAIVLATGAGLRLGWSWVFTGGLTRSASLRRGAAQSMPVIGTMMVLFFLAALIEGFLSPSSAPYPVKAAVAILSSGLLMFYFLVLGFPRRDHHAIG